MDRVRAEQESISSASRAEARFLAKFFIVQVGFIGLPWRRCAALSYPALPALVFYSSTLGTTTRSLSSCGKQISRSPFAWWCCAVWSTVSTSFPPPLSLPWCCRWVGLNTRLDCGI